MVEKFHTELDALKREVLDMGKLAREMLEKAVKALETQDTELAKWPINKRKEIEGKDSDIEEKALHLVALYQPMAKDLRTIACILKMITYVTRIGQYGNGIAKLVPELSKEPHIYNLMKIPHMADIVYQMIDDALYAFETEDVSVFEDFDKRDDRVDGFRHTIFRGCMSHMEESSQNVTPCVHYILIARYLERCADHSNKMAEKIYYMVTGEHVEKG